MIARQNYWPIDPGNVGIRGNSPDSSEKRQATSTGGEDSQLQENFLEGAPGQSRDGIGEIIGVSGRALEGGYAIQHVLYDGPKTQAHK